MPINVTPTVIKEEVITADIFTVRAFKVVMPDDNTQAFLNIYVDAGVTTNGVVDWVDQKEYRLEGQEFAAVMLAATTGGSLYDEVKAKLYEICQTKGWIPA